ncbi:xylose isomerase [Pullulanibacillus pueri]|uniref:Xylose isomerase n=1 Tax=Pullulanibacillus pueri TaxID=1437324 RepID=A0A8J2ZTG3_9BACL|nr:xylose isomerase [Pullulanibacillus pueri]MBM7681826.1 xylose isomerase [Pullulanibacillus pueri]GGH76240.1 xylose isomerase [Pullulanibacillus pueri]
MSYFADVENIKYEGKESTNPLAFKFYNPDEVIGGKTMKEWLRFSVAYWHTFTMDGTDPFGAATMDRPFNNKAQALDAAKARAEAAFEFFQKLGVPFYAFHDVDIAPEGDTLSESNKNIDEIVAILKESQKASGIDLLWNTANMFTHPRFMHGAATSSNADVYAYSAAKVKKGLEVAKELGAQNYVFWGGREGYESLLNTNMALELDNLARFYHMAVDYAKEIGYEGQFLIEPKPKEPTKHQYDYDTATAFAFLQKYDLADHFKVNIEANHATLAGHTFEHELHYARVNNILGSVDANQGDVLLGWDTDEFPTDVYATTLAMIEIIKNGGLGKGGLNFDAKVRRTSFEPIDLFYAHIVGMDSFALGLKTAHRLIEDKVLDNFTQERYKSFTAGIGLDIVNGKTDFHKLEAHALKTSIKNQSSHHELIRGVLNQYLLTNQ